MIYRVVEIDRNPPIYGGVRLVLEIPDLVPPLHTTIYAYRTAMPAISVGSLVELTIAIAVQP